MLARRCTGTMELAPARCLRGSQHHGLSFLSRNGAVRQDILLQRGTASSQRALAFSRKIAAERHVQFGMHSVPDLEWQWEPSSTYRFHRIMMERRVCVKRISLPLARHAGQEHSRWPRTPGTRRMDASSGFFAEHPSTQAGPQTDSCLGAPTSRKKRTRVT